MRAHEERSNSKAKIISLKHAKKSFKKGTKKDILKAIIRFPNTCVHMKGRGKNFDQQIVLNTR